jgi:hypothetical protein
MSYDVVSQTAPEVLERSGGRNRSLPAQDRANSFVGMLNYYYHGASGDIGTPCASLLC